MWAFFSCMAWRAITSPLSKLKRRVVDILSNLNILKRKLKLILLSCCLIERQISYVVKIINVKVFEMGILWLQVTEIFLTKQRLLFRLERGPGSALQAMQEKKALSSRGRGRLRGFLELRRPWGVFSRGTTRISALTHTVFPSLLSRRVARLRSTQPSM